MGFKRVKFKNFRNIQSREIKLSGGLNLLTGFNGSGKTNFLEGINIISGWGAIEAHTKIKDLFNRESGIEKAVLTGELEDFNEIVQANIEKRIMLRVNDNSVSSSEMRDKQPVVCFLPNDTQIVEGNAARRRRILDMMLAIIIPVYSKRLNDYRQAIKQKTALLEVGKGTEIIEKIIMPLACWIWKMRKEAVSLLFEEMQKLKDIVPEGTEISFIPGGGKFLDDEKENYKRAIQEYREKERMYKVAIVGPHRDDIQINFEEKAAKDNLSRGFRRRVSIALILAVGESVFRKTGKYPVFLLDEITAELDAPGRELLFGTLLKRNAQVFAATAEPITENFAAALYEVKEGLIERKQ